MAYRGSKRHRALVLPSFTKPPSHVDRPELHVHARGYVRRISSPLYVEVDAVHQGSTSSEQAERAKMNLYSIRCHLPGTHLPHPSWSRSCSRPLLYDTGHTRFHVWEREYNMGFPKKLQFRGPEQTGTTRCEINYTGEAYDTREQ